jgi:hypothetical protein
MLRSAHAALAAAFLFSVPIFVQAAEERPLDHIAGALAEIQNALDREASQTLFPTGKRLTILKKICIPRGIDAQQSVYDCRIDYNVADEFSSYSPRAMQFVLVHNLSDDSWYQQ